VTLAQSLSGTVPIFFLISCCLLLRYLAVSSVQFKKKGGGGSIKGVQKEKQHYISYFDFIKFCFCFFKFPLVCLCAVLCCAVISFLSVRLSLSPCFLSLFFVLFSLSLSFVPLSCEFDGQLLKGMVVSGEELARGGEREMENGKIVKRVLTGLVFVIVVAA
jgi:hypothetical protein